MQSTKNSTLNPEIAATCIQYIKKNIPQMIRFETDLIIDPNAGHGVFMEGIDSLTRLALYYDIDPQHPHVKQLDFLNFDFVRADRTFLSGLWYDCVHVISCPPFGTAPHYTPAVKFIETACTFAQTIAFILPRATLSAFSPNYTCVFQIELPHNSLFIQNTSETGASETEEDIIFGIWVRRF
jgi:hypothetical protein